MTRDEIRQAVTAALTAVAPEIDPAAIRGDAVWRTAYDLDSMDVLNVIIGLHTRLGVEVPETDYAKLATLDDAVAYLAGRIGASQAD